MSDHGKVEGLDDADPTRLNISSQKDQTGSSTKPCQKKKHPKCLMLINRRGEGWVLTYKYDTSNEAIAFTDYTLEEWHCIKGVRDFAVTVHNRKIYITGGYDVERKVYLNAVWR